MTQQAKSKAKAKTQIRSRKKQRLHIVITAGPTREYFDTVRFISNPSSGKMGYAIAVAAKTAGHTVTLISGPVAISPPKGIKIVSVISAAEMAAATREAFLTADAAIFTAAVCDYRPKRQVNRKTAKKKSTYTVELVPTEDIAAAMGEIKEGRVTIGFAMEDHHGRAHAERKLRRKHCDAIVLNHARTAGSDNAAVEFLTRGNRWQRWRSAPKAVVAKRLIRELECLVHAFGSR